MKFHAQVPSRPGNEVLVSLVVPVNDAAQYLEEFVDQAVASLAASFRHYEIIIVDDGSVDDSIAVANGLLARLDHIRLVRLSRRFGPEAAISAGLELAIGDWAVVLDPATDPPALIPELVDRARSTADMLYGIRDKPRDDPWLVRLCANLFYWYASRVIHLDLPRNASHLRVLSRKALNALLQLPQRELYLRVLPLYIGFRSESFTYTPISRPGMRRRTFGELVNTAVALTIDNSSHPLRLVSVVALAASFLNIVYAVYVVAIFLFKEDVAEGWVTTSAQNAVQFFLLSLALAALCEYTGRIFSRVGGQPSFYIMDEQSSAVALKEERRNVVLDESAEAERAAVEKATRGG